MFSIIEKKILNHEWVDKSEAQWLFLHATDYELKLLANRIRERFHKKNTATYLIMSIINFTNVCVARCDYCAFYKLPREEGGYTLSFEQICEKLEKLKDSGGTLSGLNNGFNPKMTLQKYEVLLEKLHATYPEMTFYSMTIAEFMFICKQAKISYNEGALTLKKSKVSWITGGGAEILCDSFRMRHSPNKYTTKDYYMAQKALIDEGLHTTSTMVIGFDESLEERLEHLDLLRGFQAETQNAIPSFLCWTYKPYNTALGGEEISTKEYLRWLAVCRIFLSNIKHIRTSVLTKNEGALEGLLWGANDFDIPIEDQVTEKAGATISLDFVALLSHCEKLGVTPKHRTTASLLD